MEHNNVNELHEQSMSKSEKFALWITSKIGHLGTFVIIIGWSLIWVSWNVVAPDAWKFDPYPAFVVWLIISNMVQLSLMPLIMIAQNLQSRHAEILAEEIFTLCMKQEATLKEILRKINVYP